MQIVQMPIGELTPYAKNAKKHPKAQVEQIAESIRQFGMADPIAVWGEDNTVVEGHGRLLACKKLGMETVPVIRLDHLTDEQRRAYTLAHNKLTMNTDFNIDMLDEELANILDVDMASFGFERKAEEEEEIEGEIPFTEVLGEENNFVVLKFNTDIGWLQALTVFGIDRARDHYTGDGKNTEPHIGVGRVLDGEKAIERLLNGGRAL